jgi:ATP-dependent DNA helicase RecQ
MKVLIIAKTWVGNEVCVGGLDANNRSVRLLERDGSFVAPNTYNVGEVWDIQYTDAPGDAPHFEDVLVQSRTLVGTQPNLAAHLRRRITPWVGGIDSLYEGKLGFTGSGHGYIEAPNIPSRSTWFWEPDRDLVVADDGQYYLYPPYGIKYVGVEPPLPVIPQGTLVRVSLARWWRPRNADPSFPLRCYLQLSGWYR